MKAILALENGQCFIGKSFGYKGTVIGEIVFNTGMTGYQEVLTDPSYAGQIVTMTYPMIGNYGINSDDIESDKPQVKGFIVREACSLPSNFRSEGNIKDYLVKHKIVSLKDIDTRALTKTLRNNGTMKGIIAPFAGFDFDEWKEKVNSYEIINPVMDVTCESEYTVGDGSYHVGLIDLGVKRNIIRELNNRDMKVTVLRANTDAETILSYNFDGLMLSNGPGDPKDCKETINTIKDLVGKIPIFGICLGHQLTALAMGCDTKKLKFGHRGCNHPVVDLKKDRTYITSQNHGYAVTVESIEESSMEISHINNNDQTVEGINYKNLPLFTVQFHPEACPGPHDTAYLFDEFKDMMKSMKK